MLEMDGTGILLIIPIILLYFIMQANIANTVERIIEEIEMYRKLSKHYIVSTIRRYATSGENEIARRVDLLAESALIYPVTIEPTSLIKRLEHILSTREDWFRKNIERMLRDAPSHVKDNVKAALEAYAAIVTIQKMVNHYLELSKKLSIIIVYQLQHILQVLKVFTSALYDSVKALLRGVPIGDSIGPLVVAGFPTESVEELDSDGYIVGYGEYLGRRIVVLRPKGPGANVGHPARALRKILNRIPQPAAIIMVDASLKLGGEKTGEVLVGFGAAVGDAGPEKFNIENIATERGIPLYSVLIKESMEQAVTPLRKELMDSVERAREEIKRLIREEVPPLQTVVLIGVGNAVGVGWASG